MFLDRERYENEAWFKKMIDMRDEDQVIIPLYVQIYGKKYTILEMKDIIIRFNQSAFKIGYGTADAIMMKNSFPINRIREFDVVDVFTEYDDVKDVHVRYTVFESGDIDIKEDDDILNNQIHDNFKMLYDYGKEIVDDYFKSLISQDYCPINLPEKIKENNMTENLIDTTIDDEDEDIIETIEDEEYYPYTKIETDSDYEDFEHDDSFEDVPTEDLLDYYLNEGGVDDIDPDDYFDNDNESIDEEDYSTDFDVF